MKFEKNEAGKILPASEFAAELLRGFGGALVLPVVDQVVDHRGIGQCRGVAEIAVFVLGDLAQDTAHDLARAGLWQTWRKLDQVGRRDGADLLAHPADKLLAQL